MDYNQTPESKHKLTCLCPPPPSLGAVSILTLLTPGDGTTHSPACSVRGGGEGDAPTLLLLIARVWGRIIFY